MNRIAITVMVERVMVERDCESPYEYTVNGVYIDDFVSLYEIAVEKFRQIDAKFDALHAEAFDEELAKQ